MRYATEISYNDIKNQVFESPIYFLLAFVWTKLKRALSLESKGFKRNHSIFVPSIRGGNE